jgi:hypothetical protein
MREVLACLLDYWRTHRKYRKPYQAFTSTPKPEPTINPQARETA